MNNASKGHCVTITPQGKLFYFLSEKEYNYQARLKWQERNHLKNKKINGEGKNFGSVETLKR